MDSRKLVIKRNEKGLLWVHDRETGAPLQSQVHVQLIQEPGDLTKCVVTFIADPRCASHVAIELSEG